MKRGPFTRLHSIDNHCFLKYCTARSCFSAAVREGNVPKFFRFPVLAFFFREYRRYSPDFNLRIMQERCLRVASGWYALKSLRHEILRRRMVHHDRRRALLGFEEKSRRQFHADVFLWMQQSEEFRLIFQVGTSRVAKAVA
jgi:hypothetical protein